MENSMNFDRFLHCSLNVVNTKGSIIANQFIVGIDKVKKCFNVFCEKNPGKYKFFNLPFSYIKHIGEWDNGTTVKLVKHKKETMEKKLVNYNQCLEYESEIIK